MEIMSKECASYLSKPETKYTLQNYKIPMKVRGRKLSIHRVNCMKDVINSKETGLRVTSLGQTMNDMLERPNWCGGMPTVIDALETSINNSLDEFISAVDKSELSIVKVRAGYLLEERFKIRDARIQKWIAFAQRGGSRKLDPEKAYKEPFSEKWMISINA